MFRGLFNILYQERCIDPHKMETRQYIKMLLSMKESLIFNSLQHKISIFFPINQNALIFMNENMKKYTISHKRQNTVIGLLQ